MITTLLSQFFLNEILARQKWVGEGGAGGWAGFGREVWQVLN